VGSAIAVVWGVFVHDPIPRDTGIAVIWSLFVLAMKRLSNSYVARVRRGR
jgi:hypothetical protein